MSPVEGLVERLARGLAGRTTRRSFLAQAGRVAVVVASGSAMSLVFEEQAMARVCGQSGVSPKCATYDCADTWGWCWYAKGCCADGALKKICDCCAPNTPNPVGYCPSGTRVKCIVESCGADPRVQTKAIHRARADDPVELALLVARTRVPHATKPVAILGDASSPGLAALAVSLTKVADAPVLLTAPQVLDPRVADELQRLGTEFVLIVSGTLSPAVHAALRAQGQQVTVLADATDPIPASAQVGVWQRATTGARSAIVVMPGVGYQVVGNAGAFAAAKGWPLLIGDTPEVQTVLTSPDPVRRTFVISDDPTDANRFPGGVAIAAANARALAIAVADTMVDQGVSGDTVGLAVAGDALAAAGLAGLGGPVLSYRAGSLDGAWDWLHRHRTSVQRTFVAGSSEAFADQPYYELQSLLNEFEAHLLRGTGGEGLPVISQPYDERPVGKARR